MDSPYATELRAVLAVLPRAARISRAVLSDGAADKGAENSVTESDVREKDDLSPVTVADLAIQALLAGAVRATFPSDVLVGEESADQLRASRALLDRVWELLHRPDLVGGEEAAGTDVPGSSWTPESREQVCELVDLCARGEPGSGGRAWVFDPIDGTATFVRGQMYAVNVALLESGRHVLSIIALPLLSPDVIANNSSPSVSNSDIDPSGRGTVVFAVHGHGAFARPLLQGGDGGSRGSTEPPRRLPRHADSIAADSDLGQLRAVSCVDMLPSGAEEIHAAVAGRLGGNPKPQCDLLGWVPRWASLALGLADYTVWVYRRADYRAKVWDHAGAMLLFEEVGGRVTDVRGRPIDLGAGRKLTANFGFVAAPAAVHGGVLRAVQDTMREGGRGGILEGA